VPAIRERSLADLLDCRPHRIGLTAVVDGHLENEPSMVPQPGIDRRDLCPHLAEPGLPTYTSVRKRLATSAIAKLEDTRRERERESGKLERQASPNMATLRNAELGSSRLRAEFSGA